MRKNLFLALALVFACFATANAQWMRVLTVEDGFPGTQDVVIGGPVTKTPLITPDAPIEGLRLTILETVKVETPDGHPCTAFAEIQFIDAEGNVLEYTATSNAPHTESAGIAGLNDGVYNTYFHTNWNSGKPTGDYHYIEFDFGKPVESFRMLVASRQDKTSLTPIVSVLTEKGVRGVLEADQIPTPTPSKFELKDQITTLEALTSAAYVVMQSTTPTDFTDKDTDYTGWGPRYLEAPNTYTAIDEEPTGKNAIQVIPSPDHEGRYILYWVDNEKYLGRTEFAENNKLNNWIGSYVQFKNAAALQIEEVGDGTFRMNYDTTFSDGTPVTVWVAGDPRVGQALKGFPTANYEALQKGDYTQGFGLPAKFEFKFFECDYEKPAYFHNAVLNSAIYDVYLASQHLNGPAECEDAYLGTTYYADMFAAVGTAQSMIDNGCTPSEANQYAETMSLNRVNYAYTKVYDAIDMLNLKFDELADIQYDPETFEPVYGWDENGAPKHGPNSMFCTEEYLISGKYTVESWGAIVQPIINNFNSVHIYNYENGIVSADQYATIVADLADVDKALESFLSSPVSFTEFPVVYNSENGNLPGTSVSNRMTWQSPVIRPQGEPMDGFRITFVKTEVTGSGATVNKDKYPPVALGEIAVYDAAGNKLPITADMITVNAQEGNEGPKTGLVDATYDSNGNITNFGDFYHSPWSSNYTWDPMGLIFFDIKLPEAMSAFSVKIYARNAFFYPLELCVGPYGAEFDPVAVSPNPYNVAVGNQVTDASAITGNGVYAIQGIIKTNPNEEAVASPIKPNWYAGRTTFHETVVREGCAYFLIEAGEGKFMIFNLKESKYWSEDGALVNTAAEAGKFHIVASENPDFAGQSTFVIYTDVENPEPITAACEHVDEESGLEIIIDEMEVTAPYNVLMDWGPGYGAKSRVCINFQPGVFPENYGDQADIAAEITPALAATGNLGDYLHFNKTSGEGEWKIYKLNMTNPYYYWATTLLASVPALGLEVGENPGQLTDAGSLASDIAAVQAVVDANDYAGAESAAKKLASTIEDLLGTGVSRNPIENGGTYMIEAAHSGFARKYAMNAQIGEDGNTMHWGSKPASFEDGEGMRFVFEFSTPSNVEELILNEVITEEQRDVVFTIMNVATGQYLAGTELVDDVDQASVYLFGRGTSDIYDIKDINITEGHAELHCNGHGSGAGTGGTIVLWNGDPNDTSASAWRLIKTAVPTSIDNLVVEGSEVESVKYYTVGGAEVPAPVKGINIVDIIYTNGVKETKKVVIK